ISQGQTNVDVVVLDEAGNSASCTIVLVPNDSIAPEITCPAPVTINIGTDCEDTLQDYTTLATVTDNCPGWIVEQSPAPGTVLLAGTHNITITAIDIFGNTDACVLQVDLLEFELPEITCPDPIQTCDPNVLFDDPVATDNCAVVQLNQTDLSGLTSGDTFPVGITTLSFEAIDASGNAASCSFDIEVLGVPENAIIITQNTAFCEEFELNIEAQPVTVAGAQWTVISGDGLVGDSSNPSTNFTNLSYGLNAVVWEMDFGVCGRQADTLAVMVYEQPAPAQVFGPLTLCNETEVNISAAGPTAGQGEWSSLSGNVGFFLVNSPNTLAQDFELGENVLIWEVTNGVCVPSSDTLFVLNVPPANITSQDTTICFEENDLDLVSSWTDTTHVGYLWYFIEGGGVIDESQSPITFVENLSAGQNTIVLVHTHPACQNSFDTLSVFVEVCEGYNPKIPTMFTPNNDGKNDLFVIEGLHALFPSAEVTIVNRWGSVVFQSIGYEEPWDGTKMNGGEEMPVGTYFYRIRLNDGASEEITGPISIVR
ncbi:MAG: gliding motility-associated C-terminal domain-containing protein, partial [Crocinitomicaceae bacterium]|nr:gliding motility-associated C-terminal domain-containing protein [Crocinitomicaceae bacterium]